MKVIFLHPERKCNTDCVMLPISETMWAAFSFIIINSKNEGFFFQMEFCSQSSPLWREWRWISVWILPRYLYSSGCDSWFVHESLRDTKPRLHIQPLLLPAGNTQTTQCIKAQTANSQTWSLPGLPPELSNNISLQFLGNQAFLWYPIPASCSHEPKSNVKRWQCCTKDNVASTGHWRDQGVDHIPDKWTRLKKTV